MEYRDYYKILGVDRSAKTDEIKRAYRKLARKFHPDVSKEPQAEERFKEVQEAYEVLKDTKKRAAYDQLGSDWKSGQEFRPPPGWQGFGGFDPSGFEQGESVDFSDFFASLFGRQHGNMHFGGGRQQAQQRRGRDEQARITISLEEAFKGGSRTIQLQSQGHPHHPPQIRTLKISLPAGILPGQKLRLAQQGSPGMGAPGDLYLEIQISPHPFFTLEGRDIYLTLPVTPWECALGSKVQVPTLAGRVDLKIAAGSQSGQKLRLKGRGFPGKPAGDQYVVLQMMTPPATTDEQRAFYEKMANEMAFNPREGLPQ